MSEVDYKEPFDKKFRGDEFGNLAPYRNGRPHRGQDWHPPENTVIPSCADGVVHNIFWTDVLGNVVEIKHADGIYIQYSHEAQKPKSLKKGDPVKQGQPVGRVGGGPNTPSGSASTGAHLHMAVARVPNAHLAPYDKLIDPMELFA